MLKEKASEIARSLDRTVKSRRGRDVLLYLLFVAVAFVFWLLLSLDTEVQRDFEVPVEMQDVPDSITVIGKFPTDFSVSVRGKDSQLLRFLWGKMPVMKFKWDEQSEENVIYMSRAKIDSRFRDYFGNAIQIMSFKPDSIKLNYSTLPGKRVALAIDADIHPHPQYIISGPMTANIDSVNVYAVGDVPHSLTRVVTEPIVKSGLKDTTRYEVRIKPVNGMRIIPDRVIVTVPVEPLISRKQLISVEVVNVPDDKNIITFPSKVEISYLVPMSDYNNDYPLKAYADFRSIKPGRNKLGLSLSVIPDLYRNVSFSPDSVEYIIEQLVANPQ